MASLPYPRSHQTIFPQNSRNTQKRLAEKKNLCASVKSVGEYPPLETSVNSVNSVGGLAQTNLEWVLWKEFGGRRGYGSHKTIFPQNSRNTQKRLAEKKNLCTSVKSVGEYPPLETSVNSVGGPCASKASVRICEFCGRTCASKLRVGSVEGIRRAAWVWQECHTLLHLWASVQSVGEYPPPEASVYSVNSVGGLAQTNLEWVLWEEFGGLRGYGRDAIPTQPQNYLPTEFTEHTETTGGEEKSVYICAICGRLLPARRFCGFCVFRGRFLSEAMLVQQRLLHP